MTNTNNLTSNALKQALERRISYKANVVATSKLDVAVQDLTTHRTYIVGVTFTLLGQDNLVTVETALSYESLAQWPEDNIDYIAGNVRDRINDEIEKNR